MYSHSFLQECALMHPGPRWNHIIFKTCCRIPRNASTYSHDGEYLWQGAPGSVSGARSESYAVTPLPDTTSAVDPSYLYGISSALILAPIGTVTDESSRMKAIVE